MQFEYKTILLSSENSVWKVQINRPDSLNALNLLVLSEMGRSLKIDFGNGI